MSKRRVKKKTSAVLAAEYDSPTGVGSLGGVRRFAEAKTISLRRARDVLEGVCSYTSHRPGRVRFPTLPVLVFDRDQQLVADLIEVQKLASVNKGQRYLLAVIDVLSKYAWVEPAKPKTGPAVSNAFVIILRRAQGRPPHRLQTDAGKEFYNRSFQALLKLWGIAHFSTRGNTKVTVAEWFNRTFKDLLYRYFTAQGSYKYLEALQDLVKGYNASQNRDGAP